MRIQFNAKVEGLMHREAGGYSVKVASPSINHPLIERDDKQALLSCVAPTEVAADLKLGSVYTFEGELVSIERPPRAGSNYTRGIANLAVYLVAAKVPKSA